jgi:uncharacterized protein
MPRAAGFRAKRQRANPGERFGLARFDPSLVQDRFAALRGRSARVTIAAPADEYRGRSRSIRMTSIRTRSVRMSAKKDVVRRYIDGFTKSDHEQILSCLTEDIEWTVFGAFRLQGKEAYDDEIENPAFTGSPRIAIDRMVEEGDVVMAEMTLEAQRATGEPMRAAMGEVFVFEGDLITERRAYVIELKENDYR